MCGRVLYVKHCCLRMEGEGGGGAAVDAPSADFTLGFGLHIRVHFLTE